jgi:uncharacterized protein (TIGR02246 family)
MSTRRTLLGIGIALVVPALGLTLAAGRLDETAAVKKTAADFAAAWNKHDAKAVAGCWAKDGDLIDPHGVTSNGSAEVEKFFAERYAAGGELAKVTFELKKENVRFITADVALSDWDVTLTGFANPDGTAAGPMSHHVVIVSKKEGGNWKFAAARPGTPQPEGGKGEKPKADHPKGEHPAKK